MFEVERYHRALKQGREARIIYNEDEALQIPRFIFYSLAKIDLPASVKAPSNYLYLQGHSYMGTGLWPVMVPQNNIPEKEFHTPHLWLSAHTICTSKSAQDDKTQGYCRVLHLKKAKSLEVETLPYPVRLLYNASHFFEETVADLVLAVTQTHLDLILGSPAAPAILDIPALTNLHFAKHPKAPNCAAPPTNLQDIADVLIQEYESITLYPTICTADSEITFLRQQISLARSIPLRHQLTFLCHAFDASFGENLTYCTKILKNPPALGKNIIGIALYQIDTIPSAGDGIYQLYPHLTDMLITSGTRYRVYHTNRAMRVCQAKKQVIINDSSLGRVFLVVALARDLTEFYIPTHTTATNSVHTGDIYLLPEATKADIPLPNDNEDGDLLLGRHG